MMHLQNQIKAIGRILLSLIFLMSGVHKILYWSANADYMDSQGMPAIPVFLVLAILVELGGGFSLIFDRKPRRGALLLAAYLIPVTIIFHHFWNLEGMEQQTQIINFLKNLAILGGLIVFAAHDPELERYGESVKARKAASEKTLSLSESIR